MHNTEHGLNVLEIGQRAGEFLGPIVGGMVLWQAQSFGRFGSCNFGAGRLADDKFVSGDFVVTPPGTSHNIIIKDRHVVRAFELSANLLRPVFEEGNPGNDAFDLGQLHTSSVSDQRVSALLNHLWDEAVQGELFGSMLIESAVVTLGVALLRAKQRLERAPGIRAGRPLDWRVRRAIELMTVRLGADISLIEVAAAVNLSPSHLVALFRRSTGLPPYQWFLRRRIDHARELLADSRLTVTEVALKCGFASSQHMATVFGRHVGCTPTEFRRERLR